jgi:HTH-type transcriptional regulator/antitoxin HigA
METMSRTSVDQQEYRRLVSEFPVRIIRNEKENQEFLLKLEQLNGRWDSLSEGERVLYKTILLLVEHFEHEHYELGEATPVEVINELMGANGLRQRDLVGNIFETASVASDVLNGKRELTKEHIRRLSKRFGVSPAAFF